MEEEVGGGGGKKTRREEGKKEGKKPRPRGPKGCPPPPFDSKPNGPGEKE